MAHAPPLDHPQQAQQSTQSQDEREDIEAIRLWVLCEGRAAGKEGHSDSFNSLWGTLYKSRTKSVHNHGRR